MKRNDYTRMQEGTEWYTEGMEENYFDFNQEYEAEEYEAEECEFEEFKGCGCQQRKPEKPMRGCGCQQRKPQMGCGCGCGRERRCKVIVEPTVYCRTDKEVHHCVKHIIPVVCKEVEHHHYHHNYITKTEVVKEYDRRDHGRRPQDVCKKAGCNDKFDC